MTKFLKELLPYVIIVGIAVAIRLIFLVNANIPTGSMNSTIPTESRILGLKCAYWFGEPERGDIIVFDAPDELETLYVKRIIGLPGERVEIKKETITSIDEDGLTTEQYTNVIYIDGVKLEEDYLNESIWDGGEGTYEVPEGCYFCLGDNRNNSLDARYWTNKYVPADTIYGKAYFIYWPLSEMSWLY